MNCDYSTHMLLLLAIFQTAIFISFINSYTTALLTIAIRNTLYAIHCEYFFSLNKSCMTPENFMFWMKREKKLLYITTNKCMSIKERIRNGASAYHKWLFINS